MANDYVTIEGKAFVNKAITHLSKYLVPFTTEYELARYEGGGTRAYYWVWIHYTDIKGEVRRVRVLDNYTLRIVVDSVSKYATE